MRANICVRGGSIQCAWGKVWQGGVCGFGVGLWRGVWCKPVGVRCGGSAWVFWCGLGVGVGSGGSALAFGVKVRSGGCCVRGFGLVAFLGCVCMGQNGKQISPWRFGMHGGVGGRLGVASGAKFG